MIVVTGAAGFIGSCFVWKLNQEGHEAILLADELNHPEKKRNLENKKFTDYFEKDDFIRLLEKGKFDGKIEAFFHLGACSSTTETNEDYLRENNVEYSKRLAAYAFKKRCYFSYASSAATYGDGREGYSDADQKSPGLKPLNLYGKSKLLFDLWLLENKFLDRVMGWKFFNVFGPNEYHKGEMRSLVCKAYEQIRDTGKVRLFKSYLPEYADGEQMRDFVYVKDAVNFMYECFEKREIHGIFNLGTGKARSWNDLASAIFAALGKEKNIEYIDMPETIRDKYQYFTEADMAKARKAGLSTGFRPLEESVSDYVRNYLQNQFSHL